MIDPTPDAIAFALTRVCANVHGADAEGAWLDSGAAELLAEAHQAAHRLRRDGTLANFGCINWIDLQKAALNEALRRTGGCYSRAAVLLGVNTVTVYRWRKEHGID